MIHTILEHPRAFLGVLLVGSLLSIPFVFQIKITNSFEEMVMRGEPAYRLLETNESQFGFSDDVIGIGIHADDSLFSHDNLNLIRTLTRELSLLTGIGEVLSLTNIKSVKKEGNQKITLAPLVPTDRELSEEEKRFILGHPLYRGLFISADGHSSFIVAALKSSTQSYPPQEKLLRSVEQLLNRYQHPGIQTYLAGMPFLTSLANEIVDHDNKTLLPLGALIMGSLLFLFYRRFYLVFIPFGVAAISILWTLGFMGALGIPLTIFTVMMPLVLFVVSLCHTVHILNSVWEISSEQKISGNPRDTFPKEMITAGIKAVSLPSFLNAATTMIGFMVPASSSLKSLQEMGVLIALGVLLTWGVSMILTPLALLKWSGITGQLSRPYPYKHWNLFFESFGEFVLRHSRLILLLSFIFTVGSSVGLITLSINQSVWDVYKKGTPVRAANDFFSQAGVGATGEMDLFFKGHRGSFGDPALLLAIKKITNRLEEVNGVQKTIALSDFIDLVSDESGVPTVDLTDEKKFKKNLILLSLAGNNFYHPRHYLTPNKDQYRVRLFVTFGQTTQEALDRESTLRQLIEPLLPEGISLTIAGKNIVVANTVKTLAAAQFKNFFMTILVISLCMGLFFRSFRLLVLSLIPNILPFVFVYGALGLLGIPINSFSSLAGCVGLGLAVDDTVYFISHYRKKRKSGYANREAILASLKTMGVPVILTSLVICIGFSISFFSGLTLITEFGLLVSLCAMVAVVVEFFLLPSLLAHCVRS